MTENQKPKILTAGDIEQLIRNRYAPPAYAFIPQVRNGTGSNYSRTADAIVMSLWPYRGLTLLGFEIKVNRTDWIKELKQPEKAETIAQYCDFWYVVAPRDIFKLDEIPATWGLMVPFGNTTKVIKKAEQLKPKPIDREFLAAILRQAQAVITPESKLQQRFDDGVMKGREQSNSSFDIERQEHKNLESDIKNFEDTSGVKIRYAWNKDKIGEAVKSVLDGSHLRFKSQLDRLLQDAENIAKYIKEEINKPEQPVK